MRVLHIIGSGCIGGAESLVYQLARFQHHSSDGIESMILFRNGNGYYYEKAKDEGLPIVVCSPRIGPREFVRLVKLMRVHQIIQFHGLYTTLFFAGILSRRNLLYFVHGARSRTKGIGKVISDIVVNRGVRGLTIAGLRRFIRRQWFKFFLRVCCCSIQAPSNHYIKYYQRHYGVPVNKMSKVPLGIDFIHLAVTRDETDMCREFSLSNEKVIGCISTFRSLKRIDRLIDGLSLFLENNPPFKVKLVLVGDGTERISIENQIKKNGISSAVVLTGFRNDIQNILNIMDIFVLPSESESFSISIVEAMYFKIPVIAFTGSGGAEEIVRESGGGVLVDNVQVLSEKLLYLLLHPEVAKHYGDKGRTFVLNHFRIEHMSDLLKKVYEKSILQ